MARRVWLGLLALLFGAVGLLMAWRLESDGGDTGVFAAVSVLALASGALLVAAGRPIAVRMTGGLLLSVGFAMIVTHHQLWYWMPGSWEGPVSLAALVMAVVGLTVVVLGHGFSLAGLSGALGLLALASLTLTLLDLPDVGSGDRDVLRVGATSFGAVALTAALAAASRAPNARRRWRTSTAVAAVVGAAATAYAAADSYDVYATAGQRGALLTVAAVGFVASLALGLGVALQGPPGRPGAGTAAARKPPGPSEELESIDTAIEPGAITAATPRRPGRGLPTLPRTSGTADLAEMDRRPGWVQTAAVIVGLITGVITIAKELAAAAMAIFP